MVILLVATGRPLRESALSLVSFSWASSQVLDDALVVGVLLRLGHQAAAEGDIGIQGGFADAATATDLERGEFAGADQVVDLPAADAETFGDLVHGEYDRRHTGSSPS
jgi:hypothetical protein